MLSYQHGYHAGNFADIVKHVTLSLLLQHMVQKDKPLLYLETHAGKGRYNLYDKQAIKTQEAMAGIGMLWPYATTLPEVFAPYLRVIRAVNHSDGLKVYPGSPSLAIHLLRTEDRIICCELHPKEFDALKQIPRLGKRVFYEENGLQQLTSKLPPPEKRGLVFVDPSYEMDDDYRDIPKAIAASYKRFATGMYCVWYPIINTRLHQQFIQRLNRIAVAKYLCIEFYLKPADASCMSGCGLWVINPPYTLEQDMKIALQELCKIFNPGVSKFMVTNKL